MSIRPSVSLVLVCYHSSSQAGEAVRSFREELERLQVPGEVILVDHSEDDAEEKRLRRLHPDVLICRRNRGYAAGLNAGLGSARGDTLFAGNPDIAFCEGSMNALLASLEEGFHIVGPQFVFQSWLLPAAEVQLPGPELARIVASRFPSVWKRWFFAELRRNTAIWFSDEPVEVTFLSGALLTFRRDVWQKVGEFDEGFFLYFEETDWLWRASQLRYRSAIVPAAKVTHHWAHVAKGRQAAEYMLRSRKRYFAKHFGWHGRLLTRWVPRPRMFWPSLPASTGFLFPQVLWLLSPSPLGAPAAALLAGSEPPTGALAGVVQARRDTRLYLAAVEPRRLAFLGMWNVS